MAGQHSIVESEVATPVRSKREAKGWFSQRSVQTLVIFLFCLKLMATGWATIVHKDYVYDGDHHLDRARSGGLKIDKMAYNPPLYYFPALAISGDDSKMRVLRLQNIVWVGAFYALWLLFIFPAVLPSGRSRLVASLILLALPGYQKLAAMVHPDNLHAGLSAIAIAAWLLYHRRLDRESPDTQWWPLLAVSLAIGLAGWTRPFAAVTVAAISFGAYLLALPRLPFHRTVLDSPRPIRSIDRCNLIVVVHVPVAQNRRPGPRIPPPYRRAVLPPPKDLRLHALLCELLPA